MTPQQFVYKWGGIVATAKEITIAQSHFNDLCALVGHPTPLDYDPEQKTFTFEKTTDKRGRADVFFRHKFVMEYKRPERDRLAEAYQQLLRYREALGDPPLLVTCDTRRIIIHTNEGNTNFAGRVKATHVITLDDILAGHGVKLLKRMFFDPFSFKPTKTRKEVTKATANAFVSVTDALKEYGAEPERLAHFFARIFFCLFAEDSGLLPDELFQKAVAYNLRAADPPTYQFILAELFQKMASGGAFGQYFVPHFNGNLFEDDYVPPLDTFIMDKLHAVAKQDWSEVDPAIFGQLFERVIDSEKRAQLGAHYTSEDDINLVIEPVLMQPLRHRWEQLQEDALITLSRARRQPEAQADASRTAIHAQLQAFADEIAAQTILDPACGSGNFLYVALNKLLGLQKEIIALAEREGLPAIPLTVSPRQLHGIEKNRYAHELAQVVIWVGYLQWRLTNGFAEMQSPILPFLFQIEHGDAIVRFEDGKPLSPQWPPCTVIIGNPPFLGGQKILNELGETYTEAVRTVYAGAVPASADLVAYWFEKARQHIVDGNVQRVGLLATQSIRGAATRSVLEAIKQTGDIFMAWSDREWTLDGAAVRVSIIAFDAGTQVEKHLDGTLVTTINADLTSGVDVTRAVSLAENKHVAFMGIIRNGPFEIDATTAHKFLTDQPENAQVVKQWGTARDIVARPQNKWIVDFGLDMSPERASTYRLPFAYVEQHVKPKRSKSRSKKVREQWWLFEGRRSQMREALQPLTRFIGTPLVAKHRIFVWLTEETIPDARVITFAREDDTFFGILHSKVHEIWVLTQGARHGDGKEGGRPTYNITTCFETFPLPWLPSNEPREADDERLNAIAAAARQLVALRQQWLHPVRPEGVDSGFEQMVKKRTLTNLYNGLVDYREKYRHLPFVNRQALWATQYNRPTDWLPFDTIVDLDTIHRDLDRAVLSAYKWPHTLTNDQILERLLTLNLERARQGVEQ